MQQTSLEQLPLSDDGLVKGFQTEFLLGVESRSQIGDELIEDDRFDVAGEQLQHEPVADAAVSCHRLDVGERRQPSLRPQEVLANPTAQEGGDAVEQRQDRGHGQKAEPKPEEDVDFLVQDVERQNAQAVELLQRSGRTELVEGAPGQLGKQSRHGVEPVLGILIRHRDDFKAVLDEKATQKQVH